MKRPALFLLLLLALTVVVFTPAFFGDFLHWDDTTHLINNPELLSGHWMFFWREPYYRLYLPVTYTVWTGLMALSKSTWPFHLLNLILHLLNGALVYRLTRLAFPKFNEWAVGIVTAVFLLHPLQIEPVAWISGARDTISSFFALGAACVLFGGNRGTVLRAVGYILLFALGLLAKATIAPFPVALLVLSNLRQKADRLRLVALSLWLTSGAVVLGINKMVQQESADRMVPSMALLKRLVIGLDTLGFYAMKFFVPYPLTGDYGRIPTLVFEESRFVLPLIVLALVVIGVLVLWRTHIKIEKSTLLYSVLILGPVLGIIPFMAQAQSTVADRYMYLAILGPAWLLGGLVQLKPRVFYAMVVVLNVWAAIGFWRAHVWQSNLSFFGDMLTYNPRSFAGQTTMGAVQFINNRLDLAEEHFRLAHEINPDNISPVSNWAEVFREQNRWREALEVIEPIFDKPGFIEKNDDNKQALSRCARVLALAYQATGQFALANDKFCQSLQLDPSNSSSVADLVNFERDMRALGRPVRACNP